MKKEFISIIIVNWNGKKWLKKCLDSLNSQTHRNFEVILVDNNSSDGSVKYIKRHYSMVKVVENDKNYGFAKGNNIGLKYARGDFIFLLNNDTYIEEDCLSSLLEAFRKFPKAGSVQPKILLMDKPELLDLCGAYWTDLTFLYYFGIGKNASLDKYNKPMPFFSNKGAAMMIKKDLIERIGLFDEDFWNYYEETDFCHRVWMSGYECWYWPKAIVYHAVGGTSTKFDNSYIQFHNFKNKLLSFLKNFEFKTLMTVVPIFISINIAVSLSWLLMGKFYNSLSIYRAIIWNITHYHQTLKKRKIIQKKRKKTDNDIFDVIKNNPRASYYFNLLFGNPQNYEE